MVRFLTPRWVSLHVCVLVACIGCLFAARWQWDVAQNKHAMRNYAYTVQWIFFSGFGIWFWIKIMRDANGTNAGSTTSDATFNATHSSQAPSYRGYAMPQSSAITVEDPELARYNQYLTGLSSTAQARDNDEGAVVHTEGRS